MDASRARGLAWACCSAGLALAAAGIGLALAAGAGLAVEDAFSLHYVLAGGGWEASSPRGIRGIRSAGFSAR